MNGKKRVENSQIYTELNNVKLDVAVLKEKTNSIEDTLHKIETNHLPTMTRDIKTIMGVQNELKINQAVLITKVTAMVAIAVAVVEIVLKYVFKV